MSEVPAPKVNYRPAAERRAEAAAAQGGMPQTVSPCEVLQFMVIDREQMAQGQDAARGLAHPLAGGANTAFLFWVLNRAGFRIPYIPDAQALLVYMHLQGAAALGPQDRPRRGDVYVTPGLTFGLVAKGAPLGSDWFLGIDDTGEDGSPRRIEPHQVAYFLRLPGPCARRDPPPAA